MHRHPDRHLRLEGASNFRDLGGYIGRDARVLRWRRLFRSDHLAALSEADQARLAALGVARSCDFRGVDERAATPYRWPGLAQQSLSIEPEVSQQLLDLLAAGREITEPVVIGLMQRLYRSLVDVHAQRFSELFEQLLQADTPLVFHCTAGKDRTGVAAALILLALGVPREVVMQDYLLSNELYQPPPPSERSTIAPAAVALLWGVQPSYLEAGLQAIDKEHGGVERYLSERIGLGPAALAALQARYLEGG